MVADVLSVVLSRCTMPKLKRGQKHGSWRQRSRQKEAGKVAALVAKATAQMASGAIVVPSAVHSEPTTGTLIAEKAWGYVLTLAGDISPSWALCYNSYASRAARWLKGIWFFLRHVLVLHATAAAIAIVVQPELLAVLAIKILRVVPTYCNYAVSRISQQLVDEVFYAFGIMLGSSSALRLDIALHTPASSHFDHLGTLVMGAVLYKYLWPARPAR